MADRSNTATLEDTISKAANSARHLRVLLRALTWTTIISAVLILAIPTALWIGTGQPATTSLCTL